ncbi:phenylalanine--tRNA ligase subunit beta [Candidatus Woesearchaeota archaeon]|nr:phenylalanine--tRNA ligase subunit beta [Candidatus Woesearchaeota archaeon]
MPTITLNRKVFEKLVGKRLPTDKLKERISFLGTDLESIDDKEINVEIFPNRPDMLSEQGFSRAFSSFIGEKTGLKKYNVKKSPHKLIVEESVRKARPYTAVAIVKGLHFDDEKIREVIQIQEKLHITYGRNRKKVAIGIYPFEKIKTPIRFIGMKPKDIRFQPLEYPKEINGLEILSKHPAGKEYGHLLEGKDTFPVFIDANDKILSVPPIINSHDIGKITEKTREVFIECSGFDYDVLAICLNIIVTALADMGGEIHSMDLSLYGKKRISPDLSPKEMKIDLDYVNKRLGLKLSQTDLKKYLERMGYGYEKGKALVPSYRADVLHQIDLIEDIAIAYGYENIPEVIPKVATIGSEDPFYIFKRKVSEILAGLGLQECKTFHLTNKDLQNKAMNINLNLIELANALNQEYDVLAAWNIPMLLDVLKANKHHEYPQNIFSLGTVFKKDASEETGVLEQERLASLLCSEHTDYTRTRQVLDYLLRMIGLDYKIISVEHPSFIKGRVGRVIVKGKKIAFIGEISPEVLENFELEFPVAAFELNLTELFGLL